MKAEAHIERIIERSGLPTGAGKTNKGWITPDHKFIPLPGWHYEYILAHGAEYDINTEGLGQQDEQEIRLLALDKGFVRVNYEKNTGTITFEGNDKFWNGGAKSAVIEVVRANASRIDNIWVRTLNSKGRVVRMGSEQVFTLQDKEKVNHIPLL